MFARLWFVQAATQVGGNMALYALTVLVFATTRSNTAVSALVMSFLVPTIALSAMAGVVVDRLDLRLALVGPNIVRALMTFGLALAGTNVAVLLVLNLVISLTTVMLTPAEASMIPRVVPRGQLEAAMGIFNLTLQASFAVGFAFLGPLLVAVSGPSSVLIVVTVLYVAATVACLGLPSTARAPAPPGLAGRAVHEAVAQFRDGLAAIHGDREVARPLLHLAAAATIVGVLGVLGPAIASSIGLEPNQLVVVVLPLGLGVVAGVFGLRRLGGGLSRRRAAEGGLTVFGLLIVAIALARPLLAALAPGARPEDVLVPVVVVLAFFSGSAYAATSVSAQTALFEHMPPEVRGRVFGVLATIVSAASLIPILIVGPLADLVSSAVVMAFVGAAVVVTAFLSAAASDGPRRPTA
ncbi:MAG: MFS transporter [Chloroflexi bacterium]|nr:MFS transporter [Chloroflexota bacterium]